MSRELTADQLALSLQSLGLESGDLVLVHSSYKSLGPVDGGPATVIDALLTTLGPRGTLVLPTFNFAFCDGTPYDYRTTPSRMGVLTEFGRKDPRATHVRHPIYSFAVLGRLASELSQISNISAYGPDSLFARLRELNGKIMVLGLSYNDSMTFFHHVEEMVGCDYRFMKSFTGTIIDARGERSERTYTMFVRDRERGVETMVDPMGIRLEELGLVRMGKVGQSNAKLMKAQDVFDATREIPKTEPHLLRAIDPNE